MFLLLVLSLFVITACGSSSGSSDVSSGDYIVAEFEVLVLDSNQDPVENAEVSLDQKTHSTNSQGVVVFNDIQSGSYTLNAQASDHEEHNESIIIGEDYQAHKVNLMPVLDPMVLVESGTTLPDNGSVSVHEHFYLGRYNVTQKEYETLMSKYYDSDDYVSNNSPFSDEPDSSNRPVESIRWIDAVMYAGLSILFTTIFYRTLNIYIQQVLGNLTTRGFCGYYTS
ncbi:carboxypeptidase-like regulatory domain-containing protein [Halanaerobium hydrogeniformans]|uniref:carboxypeptidase-like regulatory domain-containing protein n=1 Tax=Halanaerobium hydrogeniformans TaxID=656519 RepID=UPI0005A0C0D8|nr:carboxypeptidase-like regulatory domain-containing protein [Halanaerobium hydrogeniformans]